ncbi:IS200/IS605 family transposase [Proteus faecis]|uniref:IS200/IS605 family transposase n=1 Tax=Proteus faecis TaxID=2050967 RepID=A0ABZ3EK99_9GAMM
MSNHDDLLEGSLRKRHSVSKLVVHLLVAYPPKLAVSVMVNNLKSVSSRLLRQQNTHLRMQSKTGLLWSRSYFVCSTGGATIETFRAYVQSQSTPD